MCTQCDYIRIMNEAGLKPSETRMVVLSVIGSGGRPLKATEIHGLVSEKRTMDKVTIYRILDLLVKHGLIERIGSPDNRSFFYGLAPNNLHPAHPHFFCRMCGMARCLDPSISKNLIGKEIAPMIPGVTETVQINISGICTDCMGQAAQKSGN